MPDGGLGGWYTDWCNDGKGGPPEWETYHVEQLIPLVDQRFRTVAARRGRAIAGLSMGGFGAFSYAARHPDLFAAAASFSGGVDLNQRLYGAPAGEVAVEGTEIRDGGHPGSAFGDFTTDNIRWRGHNPPDLAVNLRGLALGLYTGNGAAGRPARRQRARHHRARRARHERARPRAAARARHPGTCGTTTAPGSHTWPYWARDLRRALPWMLRALRAPGRAAGARQLHLDRARLRRLRLARRAAAPERRVQHPAPRRRARLRADRQRPRDGRHAGALPAAAPSACA